MKNAPADYQCPFCEIAQSLPSPLAGDAVVLQTEHLYALVPTHHYGGIKGNCLVIPRGHFENVFDIPATLGTEFFSAAQRLAHAMQAAFDCKGISTRQHNGPAGNQDVWHYHLHVFPRFAPQDLYSQPKARYELDERIQLAKQLRVALGSSMDLPAS